MILYKQELFSFLYLLKKMYEKILRFLPFIIEINTCALYEILSANQ